MTVIRPNSISGITSITSHQNDVAFYKSDGSGANINNISVHTSGIITANHYGNGSNLTDLPAQNLTGTLPAISGANLTGIITAGNLPAIYSVTPTTYTLSLIHI